MRKELWMIAFGKITLGEGKMSSSGAPYSVTIPALFTHSPGKAESVFVSICVPKCLKGAPDTWVAGKGGERRSSFDSICHTDLDELPGVSCLHFGTTDHSRPCKAAGLRMSM